MIDRLFSILRKKTLPNEREEEIPAQEFLDRNSAINKKLSSFTPEQILKFGDDLIDILEYKDRCAEYGAKNPIRPSPLDIITIRENLYKRFYSS